LRRRKTEIIVVDDSEDENESCIENEIENDREISNNTMRENIKN
jgi:hypothetical protein